MQERKKRFLCRICKKKDHWANECRNKNVAQSKGIDAVAYTVVTYNTVNHKNSDEDLWIADSGAGHHITYRSDWMDDYEYLPTQPIGVREISGGIEYAVGRGTVEMISQIGNEQIEIDISNVLHVPTIGVNMFSLFYQIFQN